MYFSELRRAAKPDLLFPSIFGAVMGAAIGVSVFSSYAMLIWRGELAVAVSRGLGVAFFSGLVVNLIVGLRGKVPGTSCGTSHTAPILALAAASIASGMAAANASPDAIVATVALTVGLSSFCVGGMLFLLGARRIAGYLRFIPFPVVGGFLAGSGWLLIKGAVIAMANMPVTLAGLGALAAPEVLLRWGPGLAYGILIFISMHIWVNKKTLPTLLVIGVAIYYLATWMAGVTPARAEELGLVIGGIPAGNLYSVLSPSLLAAADLGQILGHAPNVATIMLVALVELLIVLSAIELSNRVDMDLDSELRATGVANMISGLGGGMTTFHWTGTTALAFNVGGNTRLMTLLTAAIYGVILLVGSNIISYIPKHLLGAMLFHIGATWIEQWVYQGYRKMPRSDYAILVLILLVIAFAGFLPGIALGTLCAVVLFVIKYSRTRVIRAELSGASFRSNTDRPSDHKQILTEQGDQLHVLKLQGYIFFGTSNGLLNNIKARAAEQGRPLSRVILDFHAVTGLDSSAQFSFNKLRLFASENGLQVLLSGVSGEIGRQLALEGIGGEGDAVYSLYPSLDRAMEQCEICLLEEVGADLSGGGLVMERYLEEILRDSDAAQRLFAHMERMELEDGGAIMTQGESPDALYMVESGWTEAILDLESGASMRLRKMGPGTILGEVALFLGQSRTATVVARGPCVVYRLSASTVSRLEQREPDLLRLVHLHIIRLLSERLASNSRVIQAVME